jgi:hypothetical protein
MLQLDISIVQIKTQNLHKIPGLIWSSEYLYITYSTHWWNGWDVHQSTSSSYSNDQLFKSGPPTQAENDSLNTSCFYLKLVLTQDQLIWLTEDNPEVLEMRFHLQVFQLFNWITELFFNFCYLVLQVPIWSLSPVPVSASLTMGLSNYIISLKRPNHHQGLNMSIFIDWPHHLQPVASSVHPSGWATCQPTHHLFTNFTSDDLIIIMQETC